MVLSQSRMAKTNFWYIRIVACVMFRDFDSAKEDRLTLTDRLANEWYTNSASLFELFLPASLAFVSSKKTAKEAWISKEYFTLHEIPKDAGEKGVREFCPYTAPVWSRKVLRWARIISKRQKSLRWSHSKCSSKRIPCFGWSRGRTHNRFPLEASRVPSPSQRLLSNGISRVLRLGCLWANGNAKQLRGHYSSLLHDCADSSVVNRSAIFQGRVSAKFQGHVAESGTHKRVSLMSQEQAVIEEPSASQNYGDNIYVVSNRFASLFRDGQHGFYFFHTNIYALYIIHWIEGKRFVNDCEQMVLLIRKCRPRYPDNIVMGTTYLCSSPTKL